MDVELDEIKKGEGELGRWDGGTQNVEQRVGRGGEIKRPRGSERMAGYDVCG